MTERKGLGGWFVASGFLGCCVFLIFMLIDAVEERNKAREDLAASENGCVVLRERLCTSVQAGNWLDKVWWADVNEYAARREVIGKSAREEMEFTAEWCAGYGDLWWKRMEEIAKDYQWK